MLGKTRIKAELDLLVSLEESETVSQQGLARQISVSVGMVNALLKRSIRKGLVKAVSVPRHRYLYFLTLKGFVEKSRLVAEYLDASLEFVRMATDSYEEVFRSIAANGQARVVLVGRGELAELAQTAARNAGVEIIGLFDPGSNQSRLHGLRVIAHREELAQAGALVVTESRQPQEAYDLAAGLFAADHVLAPDFLRISRARPSAAALEEDAG